MKLTEPRLDATGTASAVCGRRDLPLVDTWVEESSSPGERLAIDFTSTLDR
jgi:hypothetical protein